MECKKYIDKSLKVYGENILKYLYKYSQIKNYNKTNTIFDKSELELKEKLLFEIIKYENLGGDITQFLLFNLRLNLKNFDYTYPFKNFISREDEIKEIEIETLIEILKEYKKELSIKLLLRKYNNNKVGIKFKI